MEDKGYLAHDVNDQKKVNKGLSENDVKDINDARLPLVGWAARRKKTSKFLKERIVQKQRKGLLSG